MLAQRCQIICREIYTKIMNFSKITLTELEIEDLCVLRYNCKGRFTEHPCQDHHISHGGCMEQISWSEQVLEYFIRLALESSRTRGC